MPGIPRCFSLHKSLRKYEGLCASRSTEKREKLLEGKTSDQQAGTRGGKEERKGLVILYNSLSFDLIRIRLYEFYIFLNIKVILSGELFKSLLICHRVQGDFQRSRMFCSSHVAQAGALNSVCS